MKKLRLQKKSLLSKRKVKFNQGKYQSGGFLKNAGIRNLSRIHFFSTMPEKKNKFFRNIEAWMKKNLNVAKTLTKLFE